VAHSAILIVLDAT